MAFGEFKLFSKRTIIPISISILAFSACSFFSAKSKTSEFGKGKQHVTESNDRVDQSGRTYLPSKTVDLRPLRTDQIINTVNEVFGTTIEESSIQDADLRLVAENAEPDASGSFSEKRWKAIIKAAKFLATTVAYKSEKVRKIVEESESPRECAKRVYQEFSSSLLRPRGLIVSFDEFLVWDEKIAWNQDAAVFVLSALFSSPKFWNLIALPKQQESVSETGQASLDSSSLLWRTSLFLWRSAPDLESLAAESKGEGFDLSQWMNAAVDNEKSRRSWDRFVSSWLGLDGLDLLQKGQDVYPEFDSGYVKLLKEEVLLNSNRVFSEDRDIRELIHSKDWLIPEKLQQYYLSSSSDGPVQKRTGFLSSGAFAALTSGPYNSKPSSRGHFVMQKFLCEKVPPPPAGVGEIPAELANRALSPRQKAEFHSKNQPCAGCHALMDPIGFLLEPLDAMGRFRNDYSVLNRNGFRFGDAPIDADVRISFNGFSGSFNNIDAFSAVLAGQRKVTECLISNYLAHVYGVSRDKISKQEVEALSRNLFRNKMSPKTLNRLIFALPSFSSLNSKTEP